MNKKTKFQTIINYTFIILIILQSGTTLFYGFNIGYLFPLIFFLYLVYSNQNKLLNIKTIVFLFLTSILLIYHHLEFGSNIKVETIQFLGFLSVLIIVNFDKENYVKYLFHIIYALSLSSLIIWIGLQFSESLKSILISFGNSIPKYSGANNFFLLHNDNETSINALIYHINFYDNFRNNSLFYEPGRFTIFIILALSIHLFYYNQKLLDFKSITLILAIISTFSTTGYIALLLILYIKGSTMKISRINKYFLLILIGLLTYFIFQLDFMLNKITEESGSDTESSRFFAFLYHMDLVNQRPFAGFGSYFPELLLSPNGISFFILKYGYLYFILFLYALFMTCIKIFDESKMNVNLTISLFLVFLVLAFSQTIMDEPFYFGFVFWGLTDNKHG